MGSSLSCVSCVEREQDNGDVKPLYSLTPEDSPREEQCNTRALSCEVDSVQVNGAEKAQAKNCQDEPAPRHHDIELQERINTIVNARRKQSSTPGRCDAQLQNRINAIVSARKEQRQQQSSDAYSSADGLQAQINSIVQAHSKSLKDQRLSVADIASPSPAKSFSDMEFEYYANLALSNAKERNTPWESPSASYANWEQAEAAQWTGFEDNIAPCQLNFSDAVEVPETQKSALSIDIDLAKEEPADKTKVETLPFNLNEIPSPTRSRAKKQKFLWAEVDKDEEYHVSWPVCDKAVETVASAAEEALQKVIDDEAEKRAAEEEAARQKELEKAKWLKEVEEKANIAAMDKLCVETFLESVKRCAWRQRVRTPIKGTNLYTKHIRPSRPVGTSVDVKDSSFRSLGFFLEFLESEGLLSLRPGLTDPVVEDIFFDACRKYKYDPSRQPTALKVAPHDAGCSCRFCVASDIPAFQYQ